MKPRYKKIHNLNKREFPSSAATRTSLWFRHQHSTLQFCIVNSVKATTADDYKQLYQVKQIVITFSYKIVFITKNLFQKRTFRQHNKRNVDYWVLCVSINIT